MPRPVEALPWGSRSTISTVSPIAASAVPRLIAVVVLPTPPFWLATTRTRGERGRASCAAPAQRRFRNRPSSLHPRSSGARSRTTTMRPRDRDRLGCSNQIEAPMGTRLFDFAGEIAAFVEDSRRPGEHQGRREREETVERREGPRRHRLDRCRLVRSEAGDDVLDARSMGAAGAAVVRATVLRKATLRAFDSTRSTWAPRRLRQQDRRHHTRKAAPEPRSTQRRAVGRAASAPVLSSTWRRHTSSSVPGPTRFFARCHWCSRST